MLYTPNQCLYGYYYMLSLQSFVLLILRTLPFLIGLSLIMSCPVVLCPFYSGYDLVELSLFTMLHFNTVTRELCCGMLMLKIQPEGHLAEKKNRWNKNLEMLKATISAETEHQETTRNGI